MKTFGIAKILVSAVVFSMTTAVAQSASAGAYQDIATRCLVSSTSPEDKITLIRWTTFAYATHPDIADYVEVKDSDREAANKQVAEIFEKLITETCRNEISEVIQYEGDAGMTAAFMTLGQIAGTELSNNRVVSKSISKFVNYMDEEKVLEALEPQ